MSTKELHFPEHSPLGASSAERWMNCVGSNTLIEKLALPPSDETEFSKAGTAAHECAAHCLRNNVDTFMVIGETFNGVVVDDEMAEAVQSYIEEVNRLRAEHGNDPSVQFLIEERISDNRIDKMFYGTVDCAILSGDVWDIIDFKYGQGIAVDADDNPQMKYYAVGLLANNLGPAKIRLRIVQPRAFHSKGPIREWTTSATGLLAWRDQKLVPAMRATEIDNTLTPGTWCRFCPAKLACPMLSAIYKAMATASASDAKVMTDAQLGQTYVLMEPAMMYKRAVEEETARRLGLGKPVPGTKLVQKKSNRVFTAEGTKLLPDKFGMDAYSAPDLKTPAQIADLGPEGKKFVKEYAYSPNTGFTVALEDDTRVGVKVQSASEAFSGYKGPAAASE